MTHHQSPRGPARREFVAFGIGAFVVASVPLARRSGPRVTRRTLPIMGTFADIAVIHRDVRHAEGAIDAAFGELRRVEATMSRFRPDSEIGTVNRLAAHAPVRVGAETFGVVEAALAWARASDGAFDPAIGRVVELWDVTRRNTPPESAPLARLAGRRLFEEVRLATERGRHVIALGDPDIHLDLGGIAKGYAVDRAVEALRAWGVRDAIVNVGGDLYALGSAPGGAPWRVGVQSPDDPGTIVRTLELADRAVATSGDYAQCFRYRGVRYHHLMDPDTAAPRSASEHSITVEAASCIEADAAATALFGMGAVRARALLQGRAPDARIVTYG